MKVLVTGTAGFIGSHLCGRLIDDGLNVIGPDNFDGFYNPAVKRSNISECLGSGRFELVEGDIRDAKCVESILVNGDIYQGLCKKLVQIGAKGVLACDSV